MRIAVWHNLPSGGGKRALYYHVRGLVERGHTVESWCPPTADRDFLPLEELIKENVVPLAEVSKPKTQLGKLADLYFGMKKRLKAMDDHCRRCAEQINRRG